jgi:hypothetical protein
LACGGAWKWQFTYTGAIMGFCYLPMENGDIMMRGKRADKILNEFDFTPRQVKTIRRHINKNSQIYETKNTRESIFNFMDRYSRYFNVEYRDWYDSKRASKMWMRY